MACWCNGNCPNVARAKQMVQNRRLGRAEAELRRVLVRAPMCPEANIMLAHALTLSNRASFARVHLERAAADGMTPALATAIAHNFRMQARIEDSVTAYRLAADLNKGGPGASAAYAGLIGALEASGDLNEAATTVERAFSDSACRHTPDMRRAGALVFVARKDYPLALSMLSAPDITPIELLDRGRVRDAMGEHDAAWGDWTLAKERLGREQGQLYRPEPMQARAAALIEAAEPARLKFLPECDTVPGRQPLFICGFPRSGTTLLESALSAHSRIVPGDELMQLGEAIRLLPHLARAGVRYPAALMALASAENEIVPWLLRDFYFRKARERIGFESWTDGPQEFFTDKMPLNELHLPFIWCLFPRSPVFRMRRHPIDIVVSNFSHYLVHGGFYAASPVATATHLAIADSVFEVYRRRGVLRGRDFLEVPYEGLVREPANMIDSALAVAGLEPEPACHEPHKNPWHSRTISYRQIKEPVYTSSVERFRPYLKHLGPAVEILRPIIEREGYSL